MTVDYAEGLQVGFCDGAAGVMVFALVALHMPRLFNSSSLFLLFFSLAGLCLRRGCGVDWVSLV